MYNCFAAVYDCTWINEYSSDKLIKQQRKKYISVFQETADVRV